jgi:hypothetical protein
MIAPLRAWWPALAALAIAYFGLSDFAARYPRARESRAERPGGARPDTLLAFARAHASDSVRRALPAGGNPFRPIHPARSATASAPGLRIEPPPRNYVLKGTVGVEVATIADNAGQKRIVRVGDAIDSAQVVSIAPNRVLLKDRAGKFELQTER